MTVPRSPTRIRDQKHLSKNSYWIQLSSFMSHQNDVFAAAFSSAANASPIPKSPRNTDTTNNSFESPAEPNCQLHDFFIFLMTRSKRKPTRIWSKHQHKNRNYHFSKRLITLSVPTRLHQIRVTIILRPCNFQNATGCVG